MKKVTYVTLLGAYLFSQVHICDPKIAYLDDIANLEILSLKKNFNYQIFCRVTYVTGCYSLTLPLSEG